MPRHGFRLRGNFLLKEYSKRSSFLREEAALLVLKPHPFISELNASFKTELKNGKFSGVLQLKYYQGCDLHGWIENYKHGSPIKFVRYVFKKVLLAYDYAARHSIYHRDIKPENIMLDETGMLKLIDWELCSFKRFSSRRVGTVEYMSEEVNNGELYDCIKSDIWSLGVVIFCLASGVRPYESINPDSCDEWVTAIYEKKWIKFWHSHEHKRNFPSLSYDFKFCIEMMLKQEPEERSNLEDIMTSSFLCGDEMKRSEIVARLEFCTFNSLF